MKKLILIAVLLTPSFARASDLSADLVAIFTGPPLTATQTAAAIATAVTTYVAEAGGGGGGGGAPTDATYIVATANGTLSAERVCTDTATVDLDVGTAGQLKANVLYAPDLQCSGCVADAELADSYSGVGACGANQWATTLNDDAAPTCAQPGFTNLSGTASDAQVSGANEADELVLAGDVDGTANANDLDEAAVEAELESVLDLQDLQGAVTDAQVPNTVTITLAATATALAANGANCTSNDFALGVSAAGVAECAQPAFSNLSGAATDAQVPNTVTIDLATAATALAANGANCSAGEVPLGVSASGAAESCYDVATQAELTAHTGAADPHPQYVLLLGRAGGTEISGGTATGDYLYLTGGPSEGASLLLYGSTSSTPYLAELAGDVVSLADELGNTRLQVAGANVTVSSGLDLILNGGDVDVTGLLHVTGAVTFDTPLADASVANTVTAGQLAANGGNCAGNNFALGVDASGVGECAQPAFSNLSGAATDAQVPNTVTIDLATAATALAANGGNCAGNNFALGVDASGVGECAQPAFSNLSGAASDAQVDGSAEADELVLAGDVDGAANANDLDEVAVETELESVLDLQDLQGAVTDAQVPNTVTISLAATATALAANPADCVTATHFAVGVDAGGVAVCEAIADADVPNTITIDLAAAATALAANGGNCSGNNFALGVDASGIGECAQPAFSNLSGSATDAQIPDTITITNFPVTLTSSGLQSDAVIANYTAITGLSFSAAASTNYLIDCYITYTSTAATTGINFAWDTPASPTAIMMSGYTTTVATGANEGFSQNSDNVGTATSASVITTNNLAVLHAQFRNGSNSGTTALGFTPETANSVSVLANSVCQYRTY